MSVHQPIHLKLHITNTIIMHVSVVIFFLDTPPSTRTGYQFQLSAHIEHYATHVSEARMGLVSHRIASCRSISEARVGLVSHRIASCRSISEARVGLVSHRIASCRSISEARVGLVSHRIASCRSISEARVGLVSHRIASCRSISEARVGLVNSRDVLPSRSRNSCSRCSDVSYLRNPLPPRPRNGDANLINYVKDCSSPG